MNQAGPQSVLSSHSGLEDKAYSCPAGALVWLGRWDLSFCVKSFRQVDSRKAGGGNSGPGNKPVGVSLELDKDPISHSCPGLFGSWVWLQLRKQSPPQPRGQACGWVQTNSPHKGPLWLLGPALGSASPSGSRKMLPSGSSRRGLLAKATAPHPGLSCLVGILHSYSSELFGPTPISQPGSLGLRGMNTSQCCTPGPELITLAIFSALDTHRGQQGLHSESERGCPITQPIAAESG